LLLRATQADGSCFDLDRFTAVLRSIEPKVDPTQVQQTLIEQAGVSCRGGAVGAVALGLWLDFLFAESSEEEACEGVATLLELESIPMARLEMNKWLYLDMSRGATCLSKASLVGLLGRWDASLDMVTLEASLRECGSGAVTDVTLDGFQRWMAACFGDASAAEYKEGVASLRRSIDHSSNPVPALANKPIPAATASDTQPDATRTGPHHHPALEEGEDQDSSSRAVERMRREQLQLALEEERLLVAAMEKNAEKRRHLARGLPAATLKVVSEEASVTLAGSRPVSGGGSREGPVMAAPARQAKTQQEPPRASPAATPTSQPGSGAKVEHALEMLSYYESTPSGSRRPLPTPGSSGCSRPRLHTPRSLDRALMMLEEMERSTPRQGQGKFASGRGPPSSPVPFAEDASGAAQGCLSMPPSVA